MRKACLLLLVLVIADSVLAAHVNTARRTLEHRRRRRALTVTEADVFIGYMDEEQYYTALEVLKGRHRLKYSGVIVLERNDIKGVPGAGIPPTPLKADQGAAHAKKAGQILFQRPTCDPNVYPRDGGKVWVTVPKLGTEAVGTGLGQKWTYAEETSLVSVCGEGKPSDYTASVAKEISDQLQTVFNTNTVRQAFKDNWLLPSTYLIAKSKTVKTVTAEAGFGTSAPGILVYVFGDIGDHTLKDKPKGPLAILIRTPEMGLNPANLSPYVLAELKALKLAGINTINFYAIGAGGAANAKDCAGKINFIQASLYAGVEPAGARDYSPLTSPRLMIGYDAVSDTNPNQHIVVDNAGVNELAPEKSKFIGDNLPKLPARRKDAIQDAFEGLQAKKASNPTVEGFVTSLEAAAGAVKDSNVGMTYTYFGGFKSKVASNALSGHSANMEDYHVISMIVALKNQPKNNPPYPTLDKEGVWRVDADPYEVTQDDITALNNWFKSNKAFIPEETMGNVFEWALLGLPLANFNHRAKGLCWSFADDLDTPNKFIGTKAVNELGRDEKLCVLNPFYVELALDFWGDFKASNDGGIKPLIEDVYTAGLAADKKFMKESKEVTLAAAAAALAKAVCVKMRAYAKVGHDKSFGWDWTQTKLNSVATDDPKTNLCPVWARDGWVQGGFDTRMNFDSLKADDNLLSGALAVHMHNFNQDGTDRLFYKASNFPGIRNLNADLFSKGPSEFRSQATLNGLPSQKRLSKTAHPAGMCDFK